MISLDLIHELFAYNYWARDQQLAACRALTPEQFVQPLGGSFPSVRDTLAHLVDGEEYALHRWRGRSRQDILTAMGFSRVEERMTLWPEQFPTLAAIEARGRAIEIDVRQYLATLTDDDLSFMADAGTSCKSSNLSSRANHHVPAPTRRATGADRFPAGIRRGGREALRQASYIAA